LAPTRSVVLICIKDKKKIQQLQKDLDDKKRAWGLDKDRLLITQKELETKLHWGKKMSNQCRNN